MVDLVDSWLTTAREQGRAEALADVTEEEWWDAIKAAAIAHLGWRGGGVMATEADVRLLLSEGLDLCIRGRKLDETIKGIESGLYEMWRKNPEMTRSATMPLWVQRQYDHDLEEWEARVRKALS